MRAAILGILTWVIACDPSPPPARTAGGNGMPAGPMAAPAPQSGAPGCGMYLFEAPACEAALDQGCCVQQQNCMNDPGCRQMVQCWNHCESRRAAEGCNCFNNCAPQGAATPGAQNFDYLASCSKAIKYPENIECRTGC
ncbi:MAG: hypothetical protein R3B13_13700 [Polyangiaceae bacterium]